MRTIPGTEFHLAKCRTCGARMELHKRWGITECRDCGTPHHNLTGESAVDWLCETMGHVEATT